MLSNFLITSAEDQISEYLCRCVNMFNDKLPCDHSENILLYSNLAFILPVHTRSHFFILHSASSSIIYLPIWICYQYLLASVRLFALTTMLRTHWGNRAVSVVGNEVVRTGEMAANLSESQKSEDDSQVADANSIAIGMTKDDSEKK